MAQVLRLLYKKVEMTVRVGSLLTEALDAGGDEGIATEDMGKILACVEGWVLEKLVDLLHMMVVAEVVDVAGG